MDTQLCFTLLRHLCSSPVLKSIWKFLNKFGIFEGREILKSICNLLHKFDGWLENPFYTLQYKLDWSRPLFHRFRFSPISRNFKIHFCLFKPICTADGQKSIAGRFPHFKSPRAQIIFLIMRPHDSIDWIMIQAYFSFLRKKSSKRKHKVLWFFSPERGGEES